MVNTRSRDHHDHLSLARVALGQFPADTEELCLDWTQDAELARDRASNEPLQRFQQMTEFNLFALHGIMINYLPTSSFGNSIDLMHGHPSPLLPQ